MNKLYTTLYGSKLYGTNTPASDRDIKHIILPDLESILLGKGIKNSVKKTNTEKNTRNSVDDIDEEFIPIQIFARDFIQGQTYAIELAYSTDGTHAEQSHVHPYFKPFVKQLKEKFLTSNIKAMMGYVVNQASIYSFKGERLNAAKDFQNFLFMWSNPEASVISLQNLYNISQNFKNAADALVLKHPDYIKIDEYDTVGRGNIGDYRPCFTVLSKIIPFSNTLKNAQDLIIRTIDKYGARAEAASANNVDWKATMHALRIVDEGISLLKNHTISFPLEKIYVDKLLSIKQGEYPLDDVRNEISTKLDSLKELEKTTTLKEFSHEMNNEFENWLKDWMYIFYEIQNH